jgi:hypothetical protein
MLLGALLIKHQENLADRGAIAANQENVYLQFFVGIKEFSTELIFDPLLFVEIRKRVGASSFDALNRKLIQPITIAEDKKQHCRKDKKGMIFHETEGIFKWMLQLPANRLTILPIVNC